MINDVVKLVQIKQIRNEKRRQRLHEAQEQTSRVEEERQQREEALTSHEVFRSATKRQETENLMSSNRVGKLQLLEYRDRLAGMAARSAELSLALEESANKVEKAKASEQVAYNETVLARLDLEKIQILHEELTKKMVIEARLEEDATLDEIVSDITPHQFFERQE